MKFCPICETEKEKSEFYKSKGKLESRCKTCKREYVKKRSARSSQRDGKNSFFHWLADQGVKPVEYRTLKEWRS